jgi:hypothetical protein
MACTPFFVAQGTSGTGCLTTDLSGVSMTTGITIYCDPKSMGGRFSNIAAYFQQYRVVNAQFQFLPFNSITGQQEIVSGPTSTPSYAMRDVAWWFSKDPGLQMTSYAQIMDSGGKYFKTNGSSVLRIPNSRWLYTGASAASPTIIDQRDSSFGILNAAFRSASTSATSTYGEIRFSGTILFRYNNTGLAVPGFLSPLKDDDSKQQGLPLTKVPDTLAPGSQLHVEAKDTDMDAADELTSSALAASWKLVRKTKTNPRANLSMQPLLS